MSAARRTAFEANALPHGLTGAPNVGAPVAAVQAKLRFAFGLHGFYYLRRADPGHGAQHSRGRRPDSEADRRPRGAAGAGGHGELRRHRVRSPGPRRQHRGELLGGGDRGGIGPGAAGGGAGDTHRYRDAPARGRRPDGVGRFQRRGSRDHHACVRRTRSDRLPPPSQWRRVHATAERADTASPTSTREHQRRTGRKGAEGAGEGRSWSHRRMYRLEQATAGSGSDAGRYGGIPAAPSPSAMASELRNRLGTR